MAPLGLDVLLLQGLPGNKLELMNGKTPCAVAFRTREEAEATFETWVETVSAWKDAPARVRRGKGAWSGRVAGYEFGLRKRRIDVRVPQHGGAHFEFHGNFWEGNLWPGGAEHDITFGDHQHVEFELWAPLYRRDDQISAHPWCDFVLDDRSAMRACCAVFIRGMERWIGEPGNYLGGVPELAIEVASPATRADDLPGTGERPGVLARAGVPRYWLADPAERCLSVFSLEGSRYRLRETHRPPGSFAPDFPAGVRYDLSRVFERHPFPPVLVCGERPDLEDPRWRVPDEPVGVEHLFLAGHPLRRYEILEDQAPCALAFRDEEKARLHFEHWARELALLANEEPPERPGTTFEAGRYRLSAEGPRVRLDVRFPCREYQSFLEALSQPGVWEA
ncbi:MAG: Uma2 family endonuclease [Planctomycetes bacterium]|nr:Uma2 family endonuclease [Planctomycetota bacterium]